MKNALYEYISFLPETIQPTIASLLIMVVGYFFSKIFAAIVSNLIPATHASNEIKEEDSLPLRTRIIRVCFWVSWLIFIIIGLNQHPSFSIGIPQAPSSLEAWTSLALVIFYSFVLLLSEKYIYQTFEVLKNLYRSLPLPRDNAVFRYLIRNSWLPIVILGGISLVSPETIGYKITLTVITLLIGSVLGKVVQEAIRYTFQNKFIAKLSFYFMFTHFLMAVFNVWF